MNPKIFLPESGTIRIQRQCSPMKMRLQGVTLSPRYMIKKLKKIGEAT